MSDRLALRELLVAAEIRFVVMKKKRASDRSRDREDLAALEQGRGPV